MRKSAWESLGGKIEEEEKGIPTVYPAPLTEEEEDEDPFSYLPDHKEEEKEDSDFFRLLDFTNVDPSCSDIIDMMDSTGLSPNRAIPALIKAAVFLCFRMPDPALACEEASEYLDEVYDEVGGPWEDKDE